MFSSPTSESPSTEAFHPRIEDRQLYIVHKYLESGDSFSSVMYPIPISDDGMLKRDFIPVIFLLSRWPCYCFYSRRPFVRRSKGEQSAG